jgi:hypothetical protein
MLADDVNIAFALEDGVPVAVKFHFVAGTHPEAAGALQSDLH